MKTEVCHECKGSGEVQAGARRLKNLRDLMATATGEELATALDHIDVLVRHVFGSMGSKPYVRGPELEAARAFYHQHRPPAEGRVADATE